MSSSPYAERDVRRLLALVPAGSVDYPLLDAIANHRIRVLAGLLSVSAAGSITFDAQAPASEEAGADYLLLEDDTALLDENDEPVLLEEEQTVSFGSLLQENGDELLLEDTDSTVLANEAAGGAALTGALSLAAGTTTIPFNPHGWLHTPPGYGLSVSTGDSAVSAILTVVPLRAVAGSLLDESTDFESLLQQDSTPLLLESA